MPNQAIWKGGAFVRGAGLTDEVRVYGRGVSFVGNTTNAYTLSGGVTAAQTQFTAVAVFDWSSGAANNFPQLLGTATINQGFRLGSNASGGGDIGLVKGGVVALSTLSLTSGVPYTLVVSHRQDTGEWYLLLRNMLSGAITRASGTDTNASLFSDGVYAVGIARADFSGSWNGNIGLAYACFNFLGEGLGRGLLQNPWQLFEDPEAAFFFTAAAGGGGAIVNPFSGRGGAAAQPVW
jgi:hypothetical protein